MNAAITLADQGGIEALSMRKLAQALGVEAMSLYNHVANKAEIVDGVVDRVVAEIELPARPVDWETAVRTYAISAHDAFLRHPWACGLVMAPTTGTPVALTARLRCIEWLLRQLREAGFPPDLAYRAYHALDSHILGFTMWELGHSAGTDDPGDLAATALRELPVEEFPYLIEHIHQHLARSLNEDESEFEFGLDLILDGLKRDRATA